MKKDNENIMNIKIQEEDKKDIIELYKVAVEMADKVSHRRGVMNQFYLTLVSALFAGSVALYKTEVPYLVLIALLILGTVIAFVWRASIESYQKLNAAKFKVINKVEKQLPIQIFTDEWKYYKEDKRRDFSDIEKRLPLIFGSICVIGIVILLILEI